MEQEKDNLTYMQRWYRKNREKQKETTKEYDQTNKENKKERNRKWREKNPDYNKEYRNKLKKPSLSSKEKR